MADRLLASLSMDRLQLFTYSSGMLRWLGCHPGDLGRCIADEMGRPFDAEYTSSGDERQREYLSISGGR